MDPFFIVPGFGGAVFPKLVQKIESTIEQLYPFDKQGMHFLPFECYPDLQTNAPSILHQCSKKIISYYSVVIEKPKVTYSTFDLGFYEINQKQWLKLSSWQQLKLEHKWSPRVTFSAVLMLKNGNPNKQEKIQSIEDFFLYGSPNSGLICRGDLATKFNVKLIDDSSIQGNLFLYFQGLYVV
jgi:hypothetical protein